MIPLLPDNASEMPVCHSGRYRVSELDTRTECNDVSATARAWRCLAEYVTNIFGYSFPLAPADKEFEKARRNKRPLPQVCFERPVQYNGLVGMSERKFDMRTVSFSLDSMEILVYLTDSAELRAIMHRFDSELTIQSSEYNKKTRQDRSYRFVCRYSGRNAARTVKTSRRTEITKCPSAMTLAIKKLSLEECEQKQLLTQLPAHLLSQHSLDLAYNSLEETVQCQVQRVIPASVSSSSSSSSLVAGSEGSIMNLFDPVSTSATSTFLISHFQMYLISAAARNHANSMSQLSSPLSSSSPSSSIHRLTSNNDNMMMMNNDGSVDGATTRGAQTLSSSLTAQRQQANASSSLTCKTRKRRKKTKRKTNDDDDDDNYYDDDDDVSNSRSVRKPVARPVAGGNHHLQGHVTQFPINSSYNHDDDGVQEQQERHELKMKELTSRSDYGRGLFISGAGWYVLTFKNMCVDHNHFPILPLSSSSSIPAPFMMVPVSVQYDASSTPKVVYQSIPAQQQLAVSSSSSRLYPISSQPHYSSFSSMLPMIPLGMTRMDQEKTLFVSMLRNILGPECPLMDQDWNDLMVMCSDSQQVLEAVMSQYQLSEDCKMRLQELANMMSNSTASSVDYALPIAEEEESAAVKRKFGE